MTDISHQFTQRCQWLALFFLTICFFVSAVSVSLTTVTYILAFLFVLLSGDWRARFTRLKQNKAALSFWMIGALFIIGIFYSTSTPHLMFHDLQKRHWLFMTPFFIMMLTDDRWRQRMINAFLCAMIITLVLSFIRWTTHANVVAWIPFAKERMSAAGPTSAVFMYHISQSFAMNIAAFICAYRFLFEKKYRIFYVILFLFMAFDIIFISTGRTGYGIFFLLLFYFCTIRFGWKGVVSAVLLAVALTVAAFFISQSFHSRIAHMCCEYNHYHQMHDTSSKSFHSDKMKNMRCNDGNYQQLTRVTSVGQRLEMWSIAKTMIRAHPWFGYGTGGIQTALPTVVPAQDRIFNPKIDFVESLYLNFLLEFGLFGFIIFLIAIALQIKASFQLPHHYRCLMQTVLIAVLFGGLFNMFFVSFIVSHFYALFSAVCFSAYSEKACAS